MATNDIVQTIAEARVDARSLSEFVFKPASFMVARRLAPSVHTLQYYVDRLEAIDSGFTQVLATANAAAVTATNNAVGLIDDVTNNAYQQVSSAIDGIAIDANLVTDALVTTSIRKSGQVVRTQASKNADIINIKDFLDLDDPSIYITGHQGKQYIDHYAAFIKAEASVRIDLGATRLIGATVYLGDGDLWFSETVNLKSTTRVIGNTSGTGSASATICRFPPGKDGFIVNRQNSNGATGSVPETTAADGSRLVGIDVVQDGYVRTSSPVIDYNPTHKLILSNEHGGLAPNTIVHCYDDRLRVKMSAKIVSDSGANTGLRAMQPSRYINIPIGTSVTGSISGAVGTIAYVGYNTLGYVIKVTSGNFVKDDVITYGAQQFTVLYANPYYGFRVYALTDVIGGTEGLDKVEYGDVLCDSTQYGTGIRLRGRASIHQCKVSNFPHYGVLIATDGNMIGNANCFDINVLQINNIGINGIMTLGGDANAGTAIGLNVNACSGYGIKENSFLGNHYLSAHTSYHGIGSYYSPKTINSSVFVGCYSEGGAQLQPFPSSTSRFGKDTTVIGGIQGAGITTSGNGYGYLGSTDFRVANAIFMTNKAVDPSGLFNDSSLALCSAGVDAVPLTLMGIGNPSSNKGVKVDFRLPAGTTEINSGGELTSSKKAGSIGMVYNSSGASNFVVDVMPSTKSYSFLQLRGGSPKKEASITPVVEGGAITDLIIHTGGEGYTSAPTIEGVGEYAGLVATANMFDGKVQSINITQNITGATDTNLVQALDITDKAILGGVDGASSLGSGRIRFYKSYGVLGNLTTSSNSEQVNQLTITNQLLDAWADISTGSYQLADEVAKLGTGSSLTHFGYNAEDIYNLLSTKGIDALKLGIVERVSWRENQIDYERWFVRAEQCLVIEAAYQRRRSDRIEQRLAALEPAI